tara:strand:+ start:523 stop:1137 length:615 start_codon:yes stop_codon:yes gene_type:complete
MTIETEVAALTSSTTALTTAVGVQQTAIVSAVAGFTATTARVDALPNVENTADADKPLSSATVTELLKYVETTELATINGLPINTGLALLIASSPTSLTSALYDARAALRSPVDPQPIAGDALILEYLGLFQFYTSVTEPDDDETCFTANDTVTGLPYGQWRLRVPAYEWTEAHEKIEFRALEEWRDDMDSTVSLLLIEYNSHH